MKSATHSPLYVTKELFESRYQGCDTIFVAGSIARGEATAHSDLDLVILFPKVDVAYRESFTHKGWPVEAFIHDPETLKYFFEKVDPQIGRPTLAEMLAEGYEVPGNTGLSNGVKAMAQMALARGPVPVSQAERDDHRYHISELLDDLRDPRGRHELIAAGTVVFNEVADYYFRARGLWTANGKGVLKRMKKADPTFARKFIESFDELFAQGKPEKVIAVCEEILAPDGGVLFEGHRRETPRDWRMR